jgi:hypothetical protein
MQVFRDIVETKNLVRHNIGFMGMVDTARHPAGIPAGAYHHAAGMEDQEQGWGWIENLSTLQHFVGYCRGCRFAS